MNRNSILTILAVILFILGAYMIYLGTLGNILPPTITGLGFIIIAVGFLTIRNK